MDPQKETASSIFLRKQKFERDLALFVGFVEDEAHRIDEERNGAVRRDGGRAIMCASFLQKFIEYLKKDTKKEMIEIVLQNVVTIKDHGQYIKLDAFVDLFKLLKNEK